MTSKLLKLIKLNKKILNIISVILNILFLLILLIEFLYPNTVFFRDLQIFLGIYFIFELFMRFFIHKFSKKYMFKLINVIDLIIIIAIFERLYYIDNTFIHFLTSLKILRSYRILHQLSKISTKIASQKDLIFSILNLIIFIFFMSSIVFTLQVDINKNINTYIDSLYFTISTLTTTGFWDIIAEWESGKFLVILIMTLGTWLFLRLITVIFRPRKAYKRCKMCWLKFHEKDASHCKHCWTIIYIENEWEID